MATSQKEEATETKPEAAGADAATDLHILELSTESFKYIFVDGVNFSKGFVH